MTEMILWLFYITICIYSVLDLYQTKLLLDLGAVEANPILNWLMLKTDSWLSIGYFKGFWLSLLGVSLYRYRKEFR